MVNTPKGWQEDKSIDGDLLFEADGGRTLIGFDPDFEEPFGSGKIIDWLFSVRFDGEIKRKHNKRFKTKSAAIRHAIKWMKKYPDGLIT